MGADAGRLFCFGLGYTAQALASALESKGWRVTGTSREFKCSAQNNGSNRKLYRFDRDHPLTDSALQDLARASHVLSSVPPDEAGDPVLACHHQELAKLCGVRWVGYLSTTGVYGDRDGAWVDETTPPAPSTERGRRRAAAEAGWQQLHDVNRQPIHIFRLAGIYGPGRNQLEAVRQGRARRIDKPGQVFSRIHVDDIVAVLVASMARPNPGAIYNLADDEAAAPGAVIAYAAGLLGKPAPPSIPFDQAELSPMARSFYAENKRVRNERIKTELGVRLRYPTYRDGLQALLSDLSGKSA